MCLSFGSRRYTRDIDAVFEPKSSMYDLIHEIAQEEGIPEDWLNDGVKGWLYEQPEKVPVAVMSHLSVYSASAAYILAMKCHAARIGGSDLEDAKILAAYLGLADRNEILDLVERYIPRKYLGVKTVAFVEALLDG